MPANGQTRPVCGYTKPLKIADGTLCLWESPRPALVGVDEDSRLLGSYSETLHDMQMESGENRKHAGAEAHAGTNTSIEVTDRIVPAAMRGAPLQSQQMSR